MSFHWPKTSRILRRSDFERVYRSGKRMGSPLFTAFALRQDGEAGVPRVGFTTPRALGKAVVRNRIKRRLREAVRLRYAQLAPGWDVVFNPRGTLLDAPTVEIDAEVTRVFARLKGTGGST